MVGREGRIRVNRARLRVRFPPKLTLGTVCIFAEGALLERRAARADHEIEEDVDSLRSGAVMVRTFG
jgi:hypothetical protein